MSAPDGRCKPFSCYADGIGRGDGVGVVLLQRLSDVQPAQRIYATVRGGSMNHGARAAALLLLAFKRMSWPQLLQIKSLMSNVTGPERGMETIWKCRYYSKFLINGICLA